MINKIIVFTGAFLILIPMFTLFAIINSSGGSLNGTIITSFILTLITTILSFFNKKKELKIAATTSAGLKLILTSISLFKVFKFLPTMLEQFPLIAVMNISMGIGSVIMLIGTILRLNEALQDDKPKNKDSTSNEIEQKTFFQYCLQPLKKYADFKGRARRKEYWGFYLLVSILQFLLTTIILAIPNNNFFIIFFLIALIVSITLMIPGLSVFARRLHDTGRSGWMWSIGLIPLFGQIAILVMLTQNGEPGTNKYGVNPKGE